MSFQTFTLTSDAEIVAPKTFTLTSDATIVAPKTFTLTSDAYIVGNKFLTLNSDAVIRSPINQFTLTSDAVIVPFTPPPVPFHSANSVACPNSIKTCLPCNDDPVGNFSSEDPDQQVFCETVTFVAESRLGKCFGELSCTEVCCSIESAEDAYLCALRKAQECVWGTFREGTCAPPGCPRDCPPGCPPECPPACPPICPPPPPIVQLFFNQAQLCTVECDNGTSFTWEILAGTIVALSQAEADAKAAKLACMEANRRKICFVTIDLPVGRVGVDYKDANGQPVQIVAKGGTPFTYPFGGGQLVIPTECIGAGLSFGQVVPYHYEVIHGAMPGGLSFDCFGVIVGKPTGTGNFNFTVKVTDAIGSTQVQDYQIVVGCSPDPIKYQDSGYRYMQIPNAGAAPDGWETVGFDDSEWLPGEGAFGSGGSCPLQPTVHSVWEILSDLLVRKKIFLGAGITNLQVKCAVDNQIVELWVNGTLISGLVNHDFCPHYDDFSFTIPNGLLIAGDNVVAVRVRDNGNQSFFDMRATVTCP